MSSRKRKRSRAEEDAEEVVAEPVVAEEEGEEEEEEADEAVEDAEDDASIHPSKRRKIIDGTALITRKNYQWQTPQYRNRQRVLVFGSRGITSKYRHLLEDMRVLLPHSKRESKMNNKDHLYVVNEICELKSCNGCVFFEVRKKKDLFMWFARTPHGPSAKFHVLNVHTMDELKLTGNALRGSRPILSFDASFDEAPHLAVLKELFTQILGTPNRHPKSKPFHDHVLSFSFVDNKIWFRNWQMIDTEVSAGKYEMKMVEIGPRYILNLVRIFEGSFSGATLYENPSYVTPNSVRMAEKRSKGGKYKARKVAEAQSVARKENRFQPVDELADVFT